MTNQMFLFVEKLTCKDTSLFKTYFLQDFCSFVNLSHIIVIVLIHRQNKIQPTLALRTPTIAPDTPILRTAAKSPAKTNYGGLTETLAITDSR